jgi:hypothetical protein
VALVSVVALTLFKMVRNFGPVSKNPQHSQTLSKAHSRRAGLVQ